jgi:hypothetical protein
MTRQSQVVRSATRAGPATARDFPGGCVILCGTEGNQPTMFGTNTTLTPVEISPARDFQRCFVSATISAIEAWEPDPPPAPEWKEFSVTFIPPSREGEPTDTRWLSDPFDIGTVGNTVQIQSMNYQSIPYVTYSWQETYIGAYNASAGAYQPFQDVPSGSGQKNMFNTGLTSNFMFSVMNWDPGTQCTLLLRTDADEAVDGVNWTISTGQFVIQDWP